MSKNTTEITDLKRLRLSYNISTAEVCAELGISTSVYRINERGRRPYKSPERYEQFYYQVAHALERIHRRKLQEVQEAEEKLEKNSGRLWTNKDDLEILRQEMLNEEEEEDDLIFKPLTESLFKQALEMIIKGYSRVQVAVELGVCEIELGRKIGNMNSKS